MTGTQVYIASGVTASDRTYDGSATATVAGTAVLKMVSDDREVKGLTVSGIAAAFADKNVGMGKAVTITAATLSDTDNFALNLEKTNQALGLTANITAKPVTISGVTAATRDYEAGNLTVKLYGGTVKDVVDGDTVVVDLSAATGKMADANADTGKAVTVSGAALSGADAGNYSLLEQPASVTVTITPKSISGATVALTASEITYDGTRKAVTVAGVTLNGVALAAGDYDVSGDTTATDVSTCTVTVTGRGNYKDTATGTWKIVPKPVTITGLGAANKTYDGKTDATATGTAMINGKVDGDDVSVSTGKAGFADANVGTGKTVTFSDYSLVGSKAKNYRLTAQPASVKANITAKEIGLTWANTSFTYDGKSHKPTATATDLVSGDTCTVTVTGVKKNAGSHTAKASKLSNANYALPATNTRAFFIMRAKATVTAVAKSKTYGKADPKLKAKVTGLMGSDKASVIKYTLSRAKGENVGIYAITPNGSAIQGNYIVTYVTAKLTINKKTLTVVANNKTKMEGEKDPKLTYKVTGLVKGDKLTGAMKRKAGEKAGTYAITQGTLKASNNYKLKFKGAKLTIKNNKDYTTLAEMMPDGNTALALRWMKVTGASGYDVFYKTCRDKTRYKLWKSIKNANTLSCKITGLKHGTSYKAYVKAWKKVNGKKTYIGKASPIVHAIVGGYTSEETDARRVTVSPASMTLANGKSRKITAIITGIKAKVKPMKHVSLLRYYSSDKTVAKVNSKGEVKAVGKGSCTIYVMANNGLRASVRVTVK